MVDTLQIPTLSVNDSKDSIIVSNTNLQLVLTKMRNNFFIYVSRTKLLQTGPVPSFGERPTATIEAMACQPAAPHGKMPAKTEPLRIDIKGNFNPPNSNRRNF